MDPREYIVFTLEYNYLSLSNRDRKEVDEFTATFQPETAPPPVERVPLSFQLARLYSRNPRVCRDIPTPGRFARDHLSCQQMQWPLRTLVISFHDVQGDRVDRHCIYSIEEVTTDISSLVSPCSHPCVWSYCFVARSFPRPMDHVDEFLNSLSHVRLLCTKAIRSTSS